MAILDGEATLKPEIPEVPTCVDDLTAKEPEVESAWATHVENPFNWPAKKKWRQFLAGCLVTMLVGVNSTAVATPGTPIANRFNVDTSDPNLDNTVWPITAWNTGAALGPMIGVPFLEAFGIRNGYLVSGPVENRREL